jgi:hypothetical protein
MHSQSHIKIRQSARREGSPFLTPYFPLSPSLILKMFVRAVVSCWLDNLCFIGDQRGIVGKM